MEKKKKKKKVVLNSATLSFIRQKYWVVFNTTCKTFKIKRKLKKKWYAFLAHFKAESRLLFQDRYSSDLYIK